MPVKTPETRTFSADRGGNIAMIYALSVLALFAIAGFAIDFSRGVGAKTSLQTALDTASLTGAKLLEDSSKTDADIITASKAIFRDNLLTADNGFDCPAAGVNVVVDRTNKIVRVTADCDLQTTMAAVMNVQQVDIGARSAAKANLTRLDVAFMFDVSGSMGDPSSGGTGSKLEDLKSAAKTAADILVTPSTGDRVRLAFNTYATSVNAGIYANKVLGRPDTYVGNTCVSEREGSKKWKDDEPDTGQFLGSLATDCPSTSILPLTNNTSTFKTGVDALAAGGYTAGHIGVAWSWYLISPDWDDVWPAASKPLGYTEPDTIKAVILMTDGKFNTEYVSGQGSSSSQAKKLCKEMRDEGVIVYAVAFDAPTSAELTLKDCAGVPENYFKATNGAELTEAYRTIASRLSGLRLAE